MSSPPENVVLVRMAEIRVVESTRERPVALKTTLGSCVGVVIHDRERSVGGLAHIMLPQRAGSDVVAGKYADSAVPELLERVLERGGRRGRLAAFVAGGACMFEQSSDPTIVAIGSKNVEAAKRALERLQVPVVYEDTGGNQGRTMVFDTSSGAVDVRKLPRIKLG